MDWGLTKDESGSFPDYPWFVMRRVPEQLVFYVYDIHATEKEAREQLSEMAA